MAGIAITYGSQSFNSRSNPHIDGPVTLRRNVSDGPQGGAGTEEFEVSFECVVTGITAASMLLTALNIENAVVAPNKSLTVSVDSTDMVSYSPSSNTALNVRGTVELISDRIWTRESRRYRVTFRGELPDTTNERRDIEISVSEDPQRIKTLRISGAWQQTSGTGARANLIASIGAFASSVQGDVGPSSTWQEVSRDFQYNENDSIAQFNFEYREIIYDQSDEDTDDSSIRELEVTYNVTETSLVDSVERIRGNGLRAQLRDGPSSTNEARVNRATITSTVRVDATVDTNIESFYDATVRPYLIKEVKRISGASSFAVENESYGFRKSANVIDVNWQVVWTDGNGLAEYTLTISGEEPQTTARLTPIWDGGRFSYVNHQRHSVLTRTITETFVEVGGVQAFAGNAIPSLFASNQAAERDQGWVTISRSMPEDTPVAWGVDGERFDGVRRTVSVTQQWVARQTGLIFTVPGGGRR